MTSDLILGPSRATALTSARFIFANISMNVKMSQPVISDVLKKLACREKTSCYLNNYRDSVVLSIFCSYSTSLLYHFDIRLHASKMTTDSTGRVRDRSLKGKVAIVTGAGCAGEGIGNGRAEAILLAEDGCTVVCVDLNEEWAAKTASMINNEGHGSAYVCVADVSKAEECEKVVETAVSKFGRLDILVNNVGIPGPSGNVVEVDIDGWKSAMDVNLTSVILMSKYAIPYMKKNKGEEKGSIITLSSIAGMGGSIPHIFYAVSKGAMYTLTKTMALHHGKEGIRVNCIVPGE